MTRKIERQYQYGTHVAVYVDEVPPLGEDRKTIFLPDTGPEKMADLGGRTLGVFLASVMSSLVDRFGNEVWEIAKEVMYQHGRRRAQSLARTMKITDLSDARLLGRIMDIEDNNSGVRGEWVETGRKKAVKHEYECSQAKPYEKCPEMCTVLLEAMEEGTFDALGVKVKKPIITRVLPAGAPYCEVVLELEE